MSAVSDARDVADDWHSYASAYSLHHQSVRERMSLGQCYLGFLQGEISILDGWLCVSIFFEQRGNRLPDEAFFFFLSIWNSPGCVPSRRSKRCGPTVKQSRDSSIRCTVNILHKSYQSLPPVSSPLRLASSPPLRPHVTRLSGGVRRPHLLPKEANRREKDIDALLFLLRQCSYRRI